MWSVSHHHEAALALEADIVPQKFLPVFQAVVYIHGFPSAEEPACQCRRHRHRFNPWVREDPLEREMATHSSILAWRAPWTGEPGGLQAVESHRVGHD